MKRFVLVSLVIIMLLSITACKEGGDASSAVSEANKTSSATCDELLAAALEIEKPYSGISYYEYSSASEETKLDTFMISSYYGTLTETPDLDAFNGYAAFITDEPTVSEFAVFKSDNAEKLSEALVFCERRLSALKKKFEGYKPEMVAAAGNGLLKNYNGYVYYIVTIENNSAIEAKIIEIIDSKVN